MNVRELDTLTPTLSRRERGLCAGTPTRCSRRQRGATLVELVMVIVILAIAATAIMDQFVNAARTYQTDEQLQTATQLAQQCAEHILATRRVQGYAAATPDCTALPMVAGYATNVTFGPAPTACVTPSPCWEVTVAVTQGGTARASVVFMLGSY